MGGNDKLTGAESGRMAAIALPIGEVFERIYPAIEQTLAGEGITGRRVAPVFSIAELFERARETVASSGVVIVDITGRNPNTMWLAGLAQGMGKQVVLLTAHGEDPVFEAKTHPPLIHAFSAEVIIEQLPKLLRSSGAPGLSGSDGSDGAGSSPREEFERIFGELLKQHGHKHQGVVRKENATTYVLEEQTMDLPLVQDLARKARELGLRIKLL